MIPKQVADEFVSAIEAFLIKTGVAERPFDLIQRIFEWRSQNREIANALTSHEAFSLFVQSRDAKEEPYLLITLGLMQMIPGILEMEKERVAEKLIKEHQVEISPGRPRKLNNDAAKRRVRDSILDLFGEGIPLSVAQKRIAERNGVSLRSVQRIWKERETLGKTKPESLLDLIVATQKMEVN